LTDVAIFSTNGLDEYVFSLEELSQIPDSVIEEMLMAEAEVIKKGQEQTANSMLQGPYNRGGVVRAIWAGEPKRTNLGRVVYVTFKGMQHNTRLAEIAFINEFGKKNQPARPFIREANEKNADAAVDAAASVYDNYLKSKGL